MALPRSKEARRFYRAADCRYEEAQFLLDDGGYTTAAVYLAGYAVECILKALILSSEPESRNAATVKKFRGIHGHDFEWLTKQLIERGVSLTQAVAADLGEVDWWTTGLRYDPRSIAEKNAVKFLRQSQAIIDWAKGKM